MIYSYWHIEEWYPGRAPTLHGDRLRHHAWLIVSYPSTTSRIGSVAFAHKGKLGELPWMRSDWHGAAERILSPMTHRLEMSACDFSYIGSLASQLRHLHFESMAPSGRLFLGIHVGQPWCVVLREEHAENDPAFVQWVLNMSQRPVSITNHMAELQIFEGLAKL